jgi:hypothetical protein
MNKMSGLARKLAEDVMNERAAKWRKVPLNPRLMDGKAAIEEAIDHNIDAGYTWDGKKRR